MSITKKTLCAVSDCGCALCRLGGATHEEP